MSYINYVIYYIILITLDIYKKKKLFLLNSNNEK